MALKKDKEKVLDEVWNEDRIRGFLDVEPAAGVNKDFHCLLKAYQQMRAEDFAIFLGFFTSQGRDVNATDADGNTLVNIASQHKQSAAFITALREAGAR